MSMRLSVRAAVLWGLLSLVVGLAIGLLLGFVLSSCSDSEKDAKIALLRRLTRDGWIEDSQINDRILKLIDPQRIKENLRFFSMVPHLAGTERDKELATYIRDEWRHQGLDSSDLVPYDVLLSYSNRDKPNVVQLLAANGEVLFNSSHREQTLRPEDEHVDFIDAYHAYSPSGDVEGDLVFVNQGSPMDYLDLVKHNISVKGKIVMLREGGASVGNKVKIAQAQGAIGVITYPDPADVAADGTDDRDVYPYTRWLPGSGIVRSSAAVEIGDPLTPGYPSVIGAYQIPLKNTQLPLIPSQPISYNDAEVILKYLMGDEVPEFWQGTLNVTYRFGPGFSRRYHKVRLQVHNYNRNVPSLNVIGTIKGDVEADRYVILGNHRDAWGFGATDPSSGTAVLLEVSRVFGQLLKDGWRPRRTIVFCSWGAEEFGMIGSTEWVEHKLPKLQTRAVTYINTDICVMGDKFTTMMSSSLKDAVFQVTKKVPDPENNHESLYDAWSAESFDDEPQTGQLGPYSDFASFIFQAGIPVLDFNWQPAPENQTSAVYPTYHTGFETFHLMETLIDSDFKRHRSCGHVAALMIRHLTDSVILPLSMHQMAEGLASSVNLLVLHWQDELNNRSIPVSILIDSIQNLTTIAEEWEETLNKLNRQDPISVRIANDQMMAVERAFVSLPPQSPREWFPRHRIFYGVSSVYELMDIIGAIKNPEDQDEYWQKIHRTVSDMIISIQQATDLLSSLKSI